MMPLAGQARSLIDTNQLLMPFRASCILSPLAATVSGFLPGGVFIFVFFFFSLLASWLFGFLATWLFGFLATWLFGFLAFRLLGFSASGLFVGLCGFSWLWLFASSAFPVPLGVGFWLLRLCGFWRRWLFASSAFTVPLWAFGFWISSLLRTS